MASIIGEILTIDIIAWLHQTVLAGVVIEEGDAVDDKKHSGQAHLYEHIAILDVRLALVVLISALCCPLPQPEHGALAQGSSGYGGS